MLTSFVTSFYKTDINDAVHLKARYLNVIKSVTQSKKGVQLLSGTTLED